LCDEGFGEAIKEFWKRYQVSGMGTYVIEENLNILKEDLKKRIRSLHRHSTKNEDFINWGASHVR